jgi:hypothetical protein
VTTPTPVSAAEQRIREGYIASLTRLRAHPKAAEILAGYQLSHFAAGPLDDARISDLAVVIHRLENAIETERAALPVIALMEPDDIVRHPGFDGVEAEVVAEEEYMLRVRRCSDGG